MKKGKLSRLLAVILVVALAMSFTVSALAESAAASSTQLPFTEVDPGVLPEGGTLVSPEAANDEPLYADDEAVRIIIVFEQASIVERGFSTAGLAQNQAAVAYSDALELGQARVIDAIEKNALGGAALETRYSFTVGVNAVSATVDYGQIEAIRRTPGVAEVYFDEHYELQETADPNTVTSGEMVGAYSTWADGYTGAGSRIAIIDTGIDIDHPSFNEDAFLYSLAKSAASFGKSIEDYDLMTLEDIEAVFEHLNAPTAYQEATGKTLSAADLYVNAKIPFGYDYLMEAPDGNFDADSGDHGVHVSGIAAANKYVPYTDADGDIYFDTQENGVVGIAPDAQILALKVFSGGFGAYDSDYMAGIEDAIWLGCDTINLSLGSGSAGNSYLSNSAYALLYENLLGTDTVVTNSAGNNGNWATNSFSPAGLNKTADMRTATGGSPGSYTNSFTVASVDNTGMTGIVGSYNGVNVVATDRGAEYNASPFATLDTSEDSSGTDYAYLFLGDPETGLGIYGQAEDFDGLDLSGKIVLISRGGGVSFFEKANRAVEAGAAASVIYNNVDGTINMNLAGYLYTAPAVSLSKADADAILAASVKAEDTGLWGGTVRVTGKPITLYDMPDGYHPSSFSSWGTTENLGLKPEITAAGGNIYSTLGDGSYGLNSGTSMSAPSVTGTAAVLAQYIKENGLDVKTGLNVRTLSIALLMGTATPLIDDAVGLPYSPRVQGAGFVRLYDAVTSPSYVLVGEKSGNDGKVKFEFGDDPEKTGVYSGSFSLYNLSDAPLKYSLDSIITTMAVESYGGVDYMSESVYGLSPNVSFVTDAATSYTYDLNGDGDVDEADAMALLKVANGTVAKLPEALGNLYDLDSDGAITTADAQLYLAGLRGGAEGLNIFALSYTVPAGGSIDVTATIALSDADKAYLDRYYENGCYVEGYIQVKSESGDEKQQSIPLLAFYGNWSDPSMFDNYKLLEDCADEDAFSYIVDLANGGRANYLTFRYSGSNTAYYFMPNQYATDETYIADRIAFTSGKGDSLYSVNPSFIRNARNVYVEIRDAETEEVYVSRNAGAATGAYYSASNAAWGATSASVSMPWYVLDIENKPLEEGSRVEVLVRAVPEYYWDAAAETVKEGVGKGAYWSSTFTIDNTEPELLSAGIATDETTGARKLNISVQDNRYVAAAQVFTPDGAQRLIGQSPNQTEPGVVSEMTLDLSGIYSSSILLAVIDYAGNMKVYSADIGAVAPPAVENYIYAAAPDAAGQHFIRIDPDTGEIVSLNERAGEISILSAAYGKDGVLYAASMEAGVNNSLISHLYTVDPETFALQLVGSPEAETPTTGHTDMTYLPSVRGGTLLSSYGGYLQIVDTDSGAAAVQINAASFGTVIGLAYLETVEDANYGTVDYFAMLTNDGTIYLCLMYYDTAASGYRALVNGAYGYVSGVSANHWYGSSLHYDGTQLYASVYTGSVSKLSYLPNDAVYNWMIDLGTISAAPLCIYDASEKPATTLTLPEAAEGVLLEVLPDGAAIEPLQMIDEIRQNAGFAFAG